MLDQIIKIAYGFFTGVCEAGVRIQNVSPKQGNGVFFYMNHHVFPKGFRASGKNIGIKDLSLDFAVLHSEVPANAAGVFTRNNFPGNPVIVGKKNIQDGILQTIVVNSKNANVGNGEGGLIVAQNMCMWTAEALGIKQDNVLPSSTGVIGRKMPDEKVKKACSEIPDMLKNSDFELFSRAIMTTDTYPKIFSAKLSSGAVIAGFAKGAGMIEPNMATMLSYVISDAVIEKEDLDRLIRTAANRTFNRISIDTDTSTSDTFIAMANGMSGVRIEYSEREADAVENLEDPFLAGALDDIFENKAACEFVQEFLRGCLSLAKMVARDGEGATKLIEVRIEKARNKDQALKIARSVINSPLVKSAVYGTDPNWGRIVMAVGKVFDEPIPYEDLDVFFGTLPLKNADENMLKKCSEYLKNENVLIRIVLNQGSAVETVWGCDLTEEYVRINAYYTT